MDTGEIRLEELHPELRSRVAAGSGNADWRRIERSDPDDGPDEYVVTALSGDQVAIMRLAMRADGSVAEETTTFRTSSVSDLDLMPDHAIVHATIAGSAESFLVPRRLGELLSDLTSR